MKSSVVTSVQRQIWSIAPEVIRIVAAFEIHGDLGPPGYQDSSNRVLSPGTGTNRVGGKWHAKATTDHLGRANKKAFIQVRCIRGP